MTESIESLLYIQNGPVVELRLNRPEKLNAINAELIDSLQTALERVAHDDAVKVVLLSGEGRSFSAGFDMTEEIESATETPHEWLPVLERDSALTMSLWELPKPTIALVHGHCLGGALELAMACDMIIAAESARLGEPEILYGSGPVTLLLPFLIGAKKTRELLFTGDSVTAAAACEMGLVNRVVPDEELREAGAQLASRIAPTPLAVLQMTKRMLNRAEEAKGLRAAIRSGIEISALINGADTPEQRAFDEVSKTQGLKAALKWRSERYAQN
ncbi:MAG: enoyl-CoA hydratase/isomerase family protein [Leucobacter sp.]